MDRVDPRGGVGPRPRVPAAWVQERWAGGRRRAPLGSVAVGAGGAAGWDSTAPRSGRWGTPGATPAAESAGCTRGRVTSWFSTGGPGRPGRESTPGHDRGRGDGSWSARDGGEIGPGRAGRSPCLAQPGCRRPPTPWSRPPRACSEQGVPGAPARARARDRASRGHGRARGRTGGLATRRCGRRSLRPPAPGRGQADGRSGGGARCGGDTRRHSGRPHHAGPGRVGCARGPRRAATCRTGLVGGGGRVRGALGAGSRRQARRTLAAAPPAALPATPRCPEGGTWDTSGGGRRERPRAPERSDHPATDGHPRPRSGSGSYHPSHGDDWAGDPRPTAPDRRDQSPGRRLPPLACPCPNAVRGRP